MRYFTAIPFFFPVAASQIDWVKEYEFLDKELHQVLRDEDLGRRYADKLVNVWIENGQETFVLVHVEVQEQVDIGFSERMFVYNYRFYDRFRKPIVSLAVLARRKPGLASGQIRLCVMGF